jgi:hypothetical protein
MKTTLILVALAALLTVPVVFAEPYTGFVASTNCAGGVHTGSTCVKIPAGSTTVTPAVTDTAFGAQAGTIAFVLGPGTPAGTVFCPGDSFAIPAGATRVIVSVTDPATNFQSCGIAGASVSGELSATFS